MGLSNYGGARPHHDLVLSLLLTIGRVGRTPNLSIRAKSQVSWLTPETPALRVRQEDCCEFKPAYVVCLDPVSNKKALGR